MILGREQVERYLAMAREVGDSCPLYDVHVSPYEVIFDAFDYQADATLPGVYQLADRSYHPPAVGPLRVVDPPARHDDGPGTHAVPSALSLMMYRKLYAHVGPRVLSDHMARSGIATSLLIPVVHGGGERAAQFRLMFDMYPDDGRFAFAYCPPTSVTTADLLAEIQRVAARYPLAALKVHPNLQAIDLTTPDGRERIDALLAVCARMQLPMMIHGGLSTVVADGGSRAHAAMDNLMAIEWRRAGAPIIIGHAGLFGHPFAESAALLPKLRNILSANDNVMVDLSGLGFDTLLAVLRGVDHDRIVFGSDALYFPQWGAVVKLLHALDTLGVPAANGFAKLAGSNPARILGRPRARRSSAVS